MKRASYRKAIEWIALNDEWDGELEDLVSVVLVADLFGVEPARVAEDVRKFREKEE